MRTIAFFNNKGGVGKTTLACNVAAHFARKMRQRVLLVDCDPQCNSTQLILSEDACFDLYWNEAEPKPKTIFDVLQPIQDGDATIDPTPVPLLGSSNRFAVDILPGHPRMSIIEDKLSQAWNETTAGEIGGIRKTNWCYSFCRTLEKRYDVVIFDVGPKSALASSDHSLSRGSLIGNR